MKFDVRRRSGHPGRHRGDDLCKLPNKLGDDPLHAVAAGGRHRPEHSHHKLCKTVEINEY